LTLCEPENDALIVCKKKGLPQLKREPFCHKNYAPFIDGQENAFSLTKLLLLATSRTDGLLFFLDSAIGHFI